MFKNLIRLPNEQCIVSKYISNNIKDVILNCCFSEIFSTIQKNIKEKKSHCLTRTTSEQRREYVFLLAQRRFKWNRAADGSRRIPVRTHLDLFLFISSFLEMFSFSAVDS